MQVVHAIVLSGGSAFGLDTAGGVMRYLEERRVGFEFGRSHVPIVMGDWVVEIAHSANIVVLRTPPGSAHVVASALDRTGLADVLGTVAGDDTLLIVCQETVDGATLAGRFAQLAGL